jgi:hypothetical protein
VGESVRWVLAVPFAAVTLTCLLRLASTAHREGRADGLPCRHEDIGHIVKSVSMIAMVLSWARVLPTVVWVAMFAGQATFFGVLLLRRGRVHQDGWDSTYHVLANLGMVYMVLAMGDSTGMAGMAGMSGMAWAPLGVAFGMYFLVYAGWSLLRGTWLAPAAAGVPGWSGLPSVLSRPLAVHGCRALAGAGMAYLLLTA